MTNSLPTYPVRDGRRASLQLENAAKDYRAKAQAVREELARAQDAFARALARDDAAASTEARIAELAQRRRASRNR